MVFDLSTINILLVAAAVTLFILFITVLMKLNPSTEKRQKLEARNKMERPKPPVTSPIEPRNLPPKRIDAPRVTEKPATVISPKIESSSLPAKSETPASTITESKEVPTLEKTVTPKKAETNNSSKRDCLHQFGYLRTLPKNAPIPDECFGCPRVVECLVKAKTQEE